MRKLLIIALSLIFLIGCADDNGFLLAEETPYPNGETSTYELEGERIYIFAGGMFFGAYQGGYWVQNQGNTFTVYELLSLPRWFGGIGVEFTAMYMSIGTGLDGFNDDDSSVLENYGRVIMEENPWFRAFNLPMSMSERAQVIPMPDYNARAGFVTPTDEYRDVDDTGPTLVLSAPHNAMPRAVTMHEVSESPEIVTLDMVALVRDWLDERDLTNATVNIDQVATVDLRGDGVTQTILVANTPMGEYGETAITDHELRQGNSGVYSLVLIVEGDDVTVLHERYEAVDFAELQDGEHVFLGPDHSWNIRLLGVFDVNGDGYFEIFLDEEMWEWGSGLMFAQTNGTWDLALRSDWGS